METDVRKKKLYEALFLVDSAQASDWDTVISTLEKVLKKSEGEIVSMRKWDERKLAYEINGKSRGTYILCYFRADGKKVQEIEKAVQLSDSIMRVLILSAEKMSKEDIEKQTPIEKLERQKVAQPVSTKSQAQQKTEQGQVEDVEQTKETVKSVEE